MDQKGSGLTELKIIITMMMIKYVTLIVLMFTAKEEFELVNLFSLTH